jgi:biopolymer transport protein ExbD
MAVRLHHDDNELAENHEINVTPFIDVMLVLLIIFMVAAPLATVDVSVELPASTAQALPRPDKPIFLTLKADHTIALGDDLVTKPDLAGALDRLSNGDRSQRVFLRADKTVDYDTLMQSMNDLRAAGYLKIALVALEQSQAP